MSHSISVPWCPKIQWVSLPDGSLVNNRGEARNEQTKNGDCIQDQCSLWNHSLDQCGLITHKEIYAVRT